jgi:hypothetical protein
VSEARENAVSQFSYHTVVHTIRSLEDFLVNLRHTLTERASKFSIIKVTTCVLLVYRDSKTFTAYGSSLRRCFQSDTKSIRRGAKAASVIRVSYIKTR